MTMINAFDPTAATGISARDRTAPERDSIASNATTTLCLDVASLPSGCLDLNVSS